MPTRNANYFGDCVICRVCKQGYIDDSIYKGRCPACGAAKTLAPSADMHDKEMLEIEKNIGR